MNIATLTRWWIAIISFVLISLLAILMFLKIDNYISYKAIVSSDKNLVVLVRDNDINKILNAKLYIDNVNYDFKINRISDNYELDGNLNKYKELRIKSDIEASYLIENNVIDVSFIVSKTSVMKSIIERLRS